MNRRGLLYTLLLAPFTRWFKPAWKPSLSPSISYYPDCWDAIGPRFNALAREAEMNIVDWKFDYDTCAWMDDKYARGQFRWLENFARGQLIVLQDAAFKRLAQAALETQKSWYQDFFNNSFIGSV